MGTEHDPSRVEQLLRKALDAGFFKKCDVGLGKMMVLEIGHLKVFNKGESKEYLEVVRGELVRTPIFVGDGLYLTHECTDGRGQKIWFLDSDEIARLLVLSPRF